MDQDQNKGEEKKNEPTGPIIHRYQDDLARAMDTTDAAVVQELLVDARNRESAEKDEIRNRKQRSLFLFGSILFIVIALGSAAFAAYHYFTLTVPVSKELTVGVFASTDPVVIEGKTIEDIIKQITALDLPMNKPYLVQLVTDPQTLLPLSKTELFDLIGAKPTEPFRTAMDTMRLGAVNTQDGIKLFIIASVPDPEIATKEFLIAEPELLEMFSRALNIQTDTIATQVGTSFISSYYFNVPVRLQNFVDTNNERKVLLMYGYPTKNIALICTNEDVLRAVYDTVVRQ